MTSLERLKRRLAGRQVDRLPNLNILMSFAAAYAGVPYSEFMLNPEKKALANIKCHRDFGIDAVTVMSDPYVEAEAFGCKVEYPYDDHPHCTELAVRGYGDIDKLKVRDVSECRRMSATVKVIELYKSTLCDEVPIIGWVEGPVAEFSDIYGINNAMMDLIAEPEWSERVMDICTEQAILFAREQIKAGAHIIGIGDAAASLIGQRLYADMVFPREKRIVDAIHEAGALCKLHICGNITPILDNIARLGVDIADIDSMVDFAEADRRLSGISSANGNLDPVRSILNGSPRDIRNQIDALIESAGNTSMICGGCEIPKNTPHENLLAFIK
ncbi:MAG: uroporphyrinogen decarboxylase [Clostridiales bacterium]|nr:uroporphyrinogen decarboxylase [Clostridiales bacterium]